MLSFGFFTAEVALADSCDGDATSSAVQVPVGTDGGPAPASPGTHNVPHVCHCAHSHGTLTSDVPRLSPLPLVTRSARQFVVLPPAVVDLDTQLRPPIAFSLVG